ncbi:MAG: RagB/SusD family nutrient uptake outer membrane protein [Gemmatimonadota bacterium]|nr:RagB/SusD family nutrient uptake outer membrane protein [Gemmatimonadota bacterium]
MNAKNAIRSATLVATLFGVAACEVINPGPIQDEFLVEEESREGLVNGSQRRLSEAIGWIGYTGALVTRQIMPGGQTGSYGHTVLAQGGYILPGAYGGYFNDAQQARFIAETAINLFAESEDPVDSNVVAQANVWAGFSNRILGENWCEAVIDGSALLPGSDYLRRAEEQFGTALSLNPSETLRMAATAGRASVRAFLGDWGGAASDAGSVPDGFVYTVASDGNVATTRNTPQWANARTPYLAFTMWNTYYGPQPDMMAGGAPIRASGYYQETGDPRAEWFEDPSFPWSNASLLGYGQTPWFNQTKYDGPSDSYNVASGREMRLIEAEAQLTNGNWQAAMTIINNLRASYTTNETMLHPGGMPLEPRDAMSLEGAWTYLKRERAIELFLEARTLGDQRRWEENGTPGDLELPDFERISEIFSDNPRGTEINGQPRLCFDVPDSERERNDNIQTRGGG